MEEDTEPTPAAPQVPQAPEPVASEVPQATQAAPRPQRVQDGKFCPKCGALNRPSANFCRRCGHGLEPGAKAASALQPAMSPKSRYVMAASRGTEIPVPW